MFAIVECADECVRPVAILIDFDQVAIFNTVHEHLHQRTGCAGARDRGRGDVGDVVAVQDAAVAAAGQIRRGRRCRRNRVDGDRQGTGQHGFIARQIGGHGGERVVAVGQFVERDGEVAVAISLVAADDGFTVEDRYKRIRLGSAGEGGRGVAGDVVLIAAAVAVHMQRQSGRCIGGEGVDVNDQISRRCGLIARFISGLGGHGVVALGQFSFFKGVGPVGAIDISRTDRNAADEDFHRAASFGGAGDGGQSHAGFVVIIRIAGVIIADQINRRGIGCGGVHGEGFIRIAYDFVACRINCLRALGGERQDIIAIDAGEAGQVAQDPGGAAVAALQSFVAIKQVRPAIEGQ